jgi:hypothetical protein
MSDAGCRMSDVGIDLLTSDIQHPAVILTRGGMYVKKRRRLRNPSRFDGSLQFHVESREVTPEHQALYRHPGGAVDIDRLRPVEWLGIRAKSGVF